ncbi:MAG: LPS-assembly protein LptD, partial [Alphaproteobacteria bacterium]|nr:LPS-assembly protein LptD [Alphaproteobacteria bacterium]
SRSVRTAEKAREAVRIVALGAGTALAAIFCVLQQPPAAQAQTLSERLTQRARGGETGQTDRMLVDAQEMRFDRDKDIVEAHGEVQLYYQGRVLQADKVIYNRKTSRVFAEGRVKLTEQDGTISYATRMELTDDLQNGFIDSLQTESADKTYFTAPRAERTGGEQTVFVNGTYTACSYCDGVSDKPPLWRISAKRIIHNNSEQMVYYEDATFELWGMPIAYLPYFSTPDPSVKRKSGILAPRYIARTALGAGASVPYFWALAPHYDLTITPTFTTRQGLLGEVEWRHRLVNGAYSIRGTGIFQADPGAFRAPPFGAGDRRWRGALETRGEFHINERWRTGWDITVLSDRWFLQDYKLPSQNLSSNYFREATSTLYLTGKSERAWFDLRAYYFQGLSRSDIQAQQPIVGPVLDYNKRIPISPRASGGIGGEVEIDFNFTNIARELASFEAIGGRRLDRAYGIHNVCEDAAGNPTYNRTQCLLRGMAGQYARATVNVEWRRRFVDPIGQVWTPFVFAHVNGSWLTLDKTGSHTISNPGCGTPPCFSSIGNNFQNNFFAGQQQTFAGQFVPGAGLEYRYPFIARQWRDPCGGADCADHRPPG